MKIAQAMIADNWGGVNASSLDEGIGGREGALIRLSREWARAGHEVTNFVTTQKPERIYEETEFWGKGHCGFYEFVPYAMAKTMFATFPYDAIVAWECPSIFADPRVADRNPVRLLEMQCAHLQMDQMDAAAEFATGVIGLSQWHVDFLSHQGVEGPFHVLPNGVDLEFYPYQERTSLPSSHRFFYSSSPDRGLWHLLKLWPSIRARWPDAELKIAYGLQKYLASQIWSHRADGAAAVEISHLVRQPGIEDVGQLSQRDLAKLQGESTVLAYPCDTIAPTETGCITIIEAMAASCPVITTNCDCLADEFGSVAMIDSLPFRQADFMAALIAVLEDEKLYVEMAKTGRAFAEGRQWKDIALRWLDLFEEQNS